jgi:hypothetical protein
MLPAKGSRSAPASAQSGSMPSQGYITCLFRCVPVLQQGKHVKYASFSKDPINPTSGHTLDTRHPDGHGALDLEPQEPQLLALPHVSRCERRPEKQHPFITVSSHIREQSDERARLVRCHPFSEPSVCRGKPCFAPSINDQPPGNQGRRLHGTLESPGRYAANLQTAVVCRLAYASVLTKVFGLPGFTSCFYNTQST